VKAAAASAPGQVIIADFPEPQPGKSDLVVETLACGVCATDVKLVQKGAKELKYALGHEMTARVIHAPKDSQWKIGQHVVVAPYLPCDNCYFCQRGQPALCSHLYEIFPTPGGMSEKILVPAELARRGLFPVPDGMSDELAALAEPLGCAIKGLEDAHLQPSDSLTVIGDGPMGQLVAAAGKALDCRTVIMAGATAHRLQAAAGVFADRTVDVTKEKLADVVRECTDKRGADVVVVTVSSGETLTDGISVVRSGGWVNAFAGVPEGTRIELDVRKLHYQQYHLTGSSGVAPAQMKKALEILKSTEVDFSKIITATFPFPQVAEAVAYTENRVGLRAMVTFKP
jgi:L-iditol 2-dehydrogenase